MAKPTQNTEQAILAAAKQEFLLKGYDGARTTSIAEKAGVTHAMLHYYFRTKKNIFECIVDNEMGLLVESVLKVFGESTLPLKERLRDCISCHFDFIRANPDLPRFIINEVITRPEHHEILRKRITVIIAKLAGETQREINEAAARGEIEQMDIRMIMLDILSLNIFPFLAFPLIQPLFGELTEDQEKFFEMRKAETIETITRRIEKQTQI